MKLIVLLNKILKLPTDLNKIIVEYAEDHYFVIGRNYYDIFTNGLLSSLRLFKIIDRTEQDVFIRAYIKNGELGILKKRNILIINGVETITFNYKNFYANNILPNLQIGF